MGRFVDRTAYHIILAWNDLVDDTEVFPFILHLEIHVIPYRDRVGHFQTQCFEFAFQTALPDMSVPAIPDLVPRTGGTKHQTPY
ncbi:hypothetical protein D3C87_1897680 [compost metagenome]